MPCHRLSLFQACPPLILRLMAVCLKEWAESLLSFKLTPLRMLFTILLIDLVVNPSPLFLSDMEAKRGSVSARLPLVERYSRRGLRVSSIRMTKSSLASLPLP